MTFNAVPFNSAPFNDAGEPPPSQTGEAVGFLLTNYGTPHLASIGLAESLGRLMTIPMAFTAFDQYCQAVGKVITHFGTPMHRVNPDITVNIVGAARGFLLTQFGTPQSPYEQAGAAQGFCSTVFGYPTSYRARPLMLYGTPRLAMRQQATGLQLLAFGTPVLPHRAASLGPLLQLGAPSASLSHNVAGILLTKYGRPTAFLGGHKARSLVLGRRFGVARVFQGTACAAAGFVLARYGEPQAVVRNRATHLPPIMRFGAPTLTRNPEC